MSRKAALLLCILVAVLASSFFMLLVVAEDIVNEASVTVYIVSLTDVSNRWVGNRSKVVEGAMQASEIKKITVFLGYKGISEIDYAEVNVSVAANVVSDWNMYKNLVESGSNVIILNTHDEYLPVPSGYSKEEWVGKIADFMMNRWGTWVHVGGYPFNLTWHENGLVEVWGEYGFKTLMSHIGKGDVTCYPPTEGPKTAVFSLWAMQQLNPNWYFHYQNRATSIGTFQEANPGRPLNLDDFKQNFVAALYELTYPYLTGAIIRFSPNESTFNFGTYVHLGAWRFFDISGHELDADVAMGFIPTAAAIWADVGYATFELCSHWDGTALDAIKKAEREGRTVGLNQARELLQEGINAYNSGNYKEAIAFTKQAEEVAEKATNPPNYLAVIVTSVLIGATGLGGSWALNNRKKRRKTECAKQRAP